MIGSGAPVRKFPLLGGRPLATGAALAMSSALAVALAPGIAQAQPKAETSFSFVSEAGDPIGSGNARTYDAATATIAARGNPSTVTVNVYAGADRWTIELAAPAGEQLHPGSYPEAERAAARTGRAPGMAASLGGIGCGLVFGQFTIEQIATDPAGDIRLLDASFEQRCESENAPALRGVVKFNVYPLSYAFVSDSDDYVGAGTSKTYSNARSLFSITGTAVGLTFAVNGQRDTWTVSLDPPTTGQLSVGEYSGAQRFSDAEHPGLDVTANGRGCAEVTGSFAILEIVTSETGDVISLSATFEQHCAGAEAALRGTIHYLA